MADDMDPDFSRTAETHEVFNVPGPLEEYNAYQSDRALQQAVKAMGAGWAGERLSAFGELTGSRGMLRHGELANRHPPRFDSHDLYGRRLERVEYHPSYHVLMQSAINHGLHALPWTDPDPGMHVYRAALTYLQTQVEAGHGCPVTMTFACVPALQKQPELAAVWLPKLLSREYDPRDLPIDQKAGAVIGMAMTEKQGGSDVRANTTRAIAVGQGGPGREYELVGHKFFMSAPMSDAFLVLAQTGGGLSCLLLPRRLPDGSCNRLYIQRLKQKLGNCSNASAEVEFRGALAWLIGEEGRGVATILEMVALTRFDCLVASAGGMRQAAVQAVHHCAARQAFGRRLSEQPLMQNVLADLIVESDAALLLAMRMAQALDRREADEQESLLVRLGTAIGKYWVCKRTPGHAYEAMECLGGVGYLEQGPMPRLYREAPVNAIWEGSGNIQCLDVLRALRREPHTLDALLAELELSRGADATLDRQLEQLKRGCLSGIPPEYRARALLQQIALALQASLLIRYGDRRVAEAFIASRLVQRGGYLYGTLPKGCDCRGIIARATPA